jgi:signal transduction histidine kinase
LLSKNNKKLTINSGSLFFQIALLFVVSALVTAVVMGFIGHFVYNMPAPLMDRKPHGPDHQKMFLPMLLQRIGDFSDRKNLTEIVEEHTDLGMIVYDDSKVFFSNMELEFPLDLFKKRGKIISPGRRQIKRKGMDWFYVEDGNRQIVLRVTKDRFHIRFLMLFSFLLFVVISTFAILYFFIRRLLNPIRTMLEATEAISRGDLEHRLPEQGPVEFQQLFASFNRMSEQLRVMFSNNLLLLGNISHDLKYYLTRLKLTVEIDVENEEVRQSLDEDISQMINYIDATKDAVKMGSKGTIYEISPQNIVEITKGIAEQYKVKYQGEEQIIADVDSTYFAMILNNLLDNACKHGVNPSISLEKHGEQFVLTIANQFADEPLDENELEMLFQPFYRADQSRAQQTPGSGLGLFIVRSIADAFSLQTEVTISKDSIFMIKLRGKISETRAD